MIATKAIPNGTTPYTGNVGGLMAGLSWIIVKHLKCATEAELSKAGARPPELVLTRRGDKEKRA